MFSFLSGVMDIPFHTQSTVPASSSVSFAFQSIGLNSTSISSSSPTAFPRSISKPTSSPSSSLKPIGANVSSSPTTSLSLSAESSDPPQPVRANIPTAITMIIIIHRNFFFIFILHYCLIKCSILIKQLYYHFIALNLNTLFTLYYYQSVVNP